MHDRNFALGGRWTRWTTLVVLSTAGLMAEPQMVHADRKQASKLYREGTKAYDGGRFGDAAAAFEKAYAEDPAPIFLFNIAQARRQLGDNAAALAHYRRYLEAAPQAKNRVEVEGRIRDLEAQLARTQPAPLSPGGPSSSTSPPVFDANAGEAPSLPDAPDEPSTTSVRTAAPEAGEADGAPAGRGLRTAAFVVGGVGVAAVAAGVALGLRARSLGDTNSGAAIFDPKADDEGKQAETWQYVSYGVGAGALVTSVILFLFDGRRSSEPSRVSVAPFVATGSTGLLARGGF